MSINDELEKKLLDQPFADDQEKEDEYLLMATRYARIENAIAVLSDMKTNASYICYGGLAERLGISQRGTAKRVCTIRLIPKKNA